MKIILTIDRLRELLEYDPATGFFLWKCGRFVGKTAGTTNKRGYRQINIDGKIYYAHRLAWMFVNLIAPVGQIDHVSGDVADNRIVNLRLATQSQNNANMRKPRTNTSGFKGVHLRRDQRWRAGIMKGKKFINLGTFDTGEEAHSAYMHAARRLFGEFANAG